MPRRLTSILLCILLLTFLLPQITFAQQPQKRTSYFSFLQNYLIAYTVIDAFNKQVLSAHTKAPHAIPPSPPQPVQSSTPLSDVSTYLLNGVNVYRSSLGLAPVHSSAQTCAFAATRAQEITTNFSHAPFYSRVTNHTLPYSQWTRATENIAQAPDYKEVVTLWKNSPGHAANMRDNTPYVCIIQSGSYYAYEGMRP